MRNIWLKRLPNIKKVAILIINAIQSIHLTNQLKNFCELLMGRTLVTYPTFNPTNSEKLIIKTSYESIVIYSDKVFFTFNIL